MENVVISSYAKTLPWKLNKLLTLGREEGMGGSLLKAAVKSAGFQVCGTAKKGNFTES